MAQMDERGGAIASSPAPVLSDAIDPETDGAEDKPLESVKRLIADARTAAENEIALARACGTVLAASAKAATFWAVTAVMTAFVTLLVVALGAMLVLSVSLGMGAAMAIVVGALLLLLVIAAMKARAAMRMGQQAIAELSQ
jgi:hypothetical protein